MIWQLKFKLKNETWSISQVLKISTMLRFHCERLNIQTMARPYRARSTGQKHWPTASPWNQTTNCQMAPVRTWSMTANFSKFSSASNSGSIRGSQICSINCKIHPTLASPCHQDPIRALLKMSFFLYKAFPLSCLPLTLRQTQVAVHYSKLWINNLCLFSSGGLYFLYFFIIIVFLKVPWGCLHCLSPPTPAFMECCPLGPVICVDLVIQHWVWTLLFALSSLAIDSQFDTPVLLLVSIRLTSLVDSGHSFIFLILFLLSFLLLFCVVIARNAICYRRKYRHRPFKTCLS